ncbi:MAG: MFS transporter [Clostridia bacterium]|nr:MFS transporter [Clostridia bacterium]
MNDKSSSLTKRSWFTIVFFGLMGQIAWNVENIYFNTFLYNSVYEKGAAAGEPPVTKAIAIMVALSAATAVVTTFLMGTLSDRINRRKAFISVGYIAWGAVTAAFGLISKENVAAVTGISDPAKVLTFTVWTVIIMDCVMTFMGSTRHDSAFNAWVTDVTSEGNRPLVETVLTALPVVAMGVVAGLGAVVVNTGYPLFFLMLGGTVSVCGVIGLFTIRDSKTGVARGEKRKTGYFSELVYGFRPRVIADNSRLYLALCAVCLFSVAGQVFTPYIVIYLQHVILPATGELFTSGVIAPAAAGIAVLAAGIAAVMLTAKKWGREKALIVAAALFTAGLFLTAYGKNAGTFILCAAPMGAGYIPLIILLNASVRDLTPEDNVGLFQGVRMIFTVLLPMVIGPAIGDIAIRSSSVGYINEYGVEATVPTALMFTCAGAVGALVFIPVIALNVLKLKKKSGSPAADGNT